LMRMAAGKLADLPEWELKSLLGRHLWQDSLHADRWLARLIDLRWPRRAPLSPGEPLRRLMALLDDAPGSAAFVGGIYRQVKPRLIAAYTAHRAVCAPLADEPTWDLLGRTIADEEEQVRQGLALLESLPAADRAAARDYELLVADACEAVGSFADPATAAEREAGGSFEGQQIRPAPSVAARDGRFRFGTSAADRPPVDDHELALVMAHRDADNEMHAAELLGRSLYEHPEMPWEYHVDTARQLWDEVRHALIYQRYLEQLGIDWRRLIAIHPGMSIRLLSLDTEDAHTVLYAIEQKLMPGNSGKRLEYEISCNANDPLAAHIQDYDWADEVLHVHIGREWLLPELKLRPNEAVERGWALRAATARILDDYEHLGEQINWWPALVQEVLGRESAVQTFDLTRQ